jgi:glycosyltransferase involved in cell wall biosynthesis
MIPDKLVVENKTVYYVEGWIFGSSLVKDICILYDGNKFPATDHSIYRPDVLTAYYRIDKKLNSLFSGFRIPVIIQPVSIEEKKSIQLIVKFKDGEVFSTSLGNVSLMPPEDRRIKMQGSKVPTLAICMATYNPNKELFRKQIESIRNQDYKDWICIISDDNSRKEYLKHIYEIVGCDPRFIIIEHNENKGFYYNFERCLRYVPSGVKYIALSDQDDNWYHNKLSEAVRALEQNPNIQLVYCDMKIVNSKGEILSETYWTKRKNYYRSEDLDLLTIANTVTGAASVFRADLLSDILPFPPRYGDVYHDQWIAIIAAAKGGIYYIDKPLYDYVQSGENIIGHIEFDQKSVLKMLSEHGHFQNIRINLKNREIPFKLRWKLVFKDMFSACIVLYNFKHNNARHIFTLMENAVLRNVENRYQLLITRPKTIRGLRKISRKVRKNKETINNLDKILMASLILNKVTKGFVIPFRKLLRKLTQSLNKGLIVPQSVGKSGKTLAVDQMLVEYKRKFSGRVFKVSAGRDQTVNVLISLVDPNNFFGGYIGMFNFAKRIHQLGYRVRLIMTDQKELSEENIEKIKNHDKSLSTFLSEVEYQPCYNHETIVPISKEDIFVATSWWTAYIANEAVQLTEFDKFIYLAQDYEPIFYEHGAYRVLSHNSYKLNYFPFFSTEILQKFFVETKIVDAKNCGVYFNNPVLEFEISEEKLEKQKRRKRRLLFYARPQPHNARNLYPIGCLALDRAHEMGGFPEEEWEIIAIGGDRGLQMLPSGLKIKHIGKFGLDEYKDLLPQHDLGLALMDSPHPSLLPIEMAAAGLLVVTNTYGTIKDKEYFSRISENIYAVEPTIESLAEKLLELSDQVDNYQKRARGSKLNWPHAWEVALPENNIKKAIENIKNSRRVSQKAF